MIDNTLMIKQMKKQADLYFMFSRVTNMPYVECEPETFDDMIHVFSTESEVQEFAKNYSERKIALLAKKVPKAQVMSTIYSLYTIGINAIVFHNNGTSAKIPLEELAKKPDLEKIQASPTPIMNPTLTLSTLYFLQEAVRPVEHDRKQLVELEEEMVVNLVRSKFILGISAANPKEKFDPKNPNQVKNVCYVKDNEGNSLLPAFSDIGEFQRFFGAKAPTMGMAVITFDKLSKSLTKEAKGVVVNPLGYRLRIERENLQKITQKFFK